MDAYRKGSDEAKECLALSKKSEAALADSAHAFVVVRKKINDIAVASKDQTASTMFISENINGISSSAIKSSENINKTAETMRELNLRVQELRQLVQRFKLNR